MKEGRASGDGTRTKDRLTSREASMMGRTFVMVAGMVTVSLRRVGDKESFWTCGCSGQGIRSQLMAAELS